MPEAGWMKVTGTSPLTTKSVARLRIPSETLSHSEILCAKGGETLGVPNKSHK